LLFQAQPFVITLCVLALLYFRSVHLVYMLAGSTICAFLAKGLKRVIRQPRPIDTKDPSISKKDTYGMPSSHSQAMAFFGWYTFQSDIWDTPFAICLYLFTLMVLWSRWRLGHHTFSQVAVGTVVGVALAHVWYKFWLIKVEFFSHHVLCNDYSICL
ncbi:PAP2 superfamily-domain-containing protein, partial [Zychaea mexicana]|uniref:PAP2 superfamily-domain-containing protein n=1 Tax=Zychaea mexicana TaxID=64656 RepID=UPI0022FE60E6